MVKLKGYSSVWTELRSPLGIICRVVFYVELIQTLVEVYTINLFRICFEKLPLHSEKFMYWITLISRITWIQLESGVGSFCWISVQILVCLDCFSHSITMEVLICWDLLGEKQPKFAETSTPEWSMTEVYWKLSVSQLALWCNGYYSWLRIGRLCV